MLKEIQKQQDEMFAKKLGQKCKKHIDSFTDECGCIIEVLHHRDTIIIEAVREIVMKENYELEEWYASSERPNTLTHFQASQKNMETRNKIIDLLSTLK